MKQRAHILQAYLPPVLRVTLHTLALIVLIALADVSLLLALLVKPFSESTAWRLACRTAESFWGYMQTHWETDLNASSTITVEGDTVPPEESAFVIANHQGFSDFYLSQHVARKAGMLGSCRYFVKKEIVWQIPLFGWAFWGLGMILVSRNWASDSRLLEESLQRVKDNKHPIWIVLYPEGTRKTPKKLLQAQAFARQKGLTELKHMLYPRTKGFVASVQALRSSHIKYVYSLTFLYKAPGPSAKRYNAPSLSTQLGEINLAQAGYGYRIHVKRVPMSDLPEDDEGLKKWCEEDWARRDGLIDSWISKGV